MEYLRNENAGDPTKSSTAGALKKPDQGEDRKSRAYPDGTDMNIHDTRKRHANDLNGRSKLNVRGV
jgi:hypothetical protein